MSALFCRLVFIASLRRFKPVGLDGAIEFLQRSRKHLFLELVADSSGCPVPSNFIQARASCRQNSLSAWCRGS